MMEVQRNKEERKMKPWKFPVRLFQLLQEATTSKTSGDDTIVSWLPDGSGFMILNHVAFESTLMPKYFEKMSCYRSFRRQLNLYGIKKVIDFGGVGAYFHPLFHRDRPDLVFKMKRPSSKFSKTSLSSGASVVSSQNTNTTDPQDRANNIDIATHEVGALVKDHTDIEQSFWNQACDVAMCLLDQEKQEKPERDDGTLAVAPLGGKLGRVRSITKEPRTMIRITSLGPVSFDLGDMDLSGNRSPPVSTKYPQGHLALARNMLHRKEKIDLKNQSWDTAPVSECTKSSMAAFAPVLHNFIPNDITDEIISTFPW